MVHTRCCKKAYPFIKVIEANLSFCVVVAYMSYPSQHVRCSLCDKTYSNMSNLRTHMLDVHEDIPEDQWLSCEYCEKKFKTKHKLINHRNRSHGIFRKQTMSFY